MGTTKPVLGAVANVLTLLHCTAMASGRELTEETIPHTSDDTTRLVFVIVGVVCVTLIFMMITLVVSRKCITPSLTKGRSTSQSTISSRTRSHRVSRADVMKHTIVDMLEPVPKDALLGSIKHLELEIAYLEKKLTDTARSSVSMLDRNKHAVETYQTKYRKKLKGLQAELRALRRRVGVAETPTSNTRWSLGPRSASSSKTDLRERAKSLPGWGPRPLSQSNATEVSVAASPLLSSPVVTISVEDVASSPKSFPRTSVSVPALNIDSNAEIGVNVCPLCLLTIADDHLVRILPSCSHKFHVSCMDDHIGLNDTQSNHSDHTLSDDQATCPLCRTPIIAVPEDDQV